MPKQDGVSEAGPEAERGMGAAGKAEAGRVIQPVPNVWSVMIVMYCLDKPIMTNVTDGMNIPSSPNVQQYSKDNEK